MARRQVKNASKAIEKWASRMQGAAQPYRDGVSGYQGNPMELAASADALARYAANTSKAAVPGGSMERGLRAPGVADRWRTNSITIGAQRLTSGAEKGKAKLKEKEAKLQALWQRASDAANALPKGDSRGRMLANLDVMEQAKGTI